MFGNSARISHSSDKMEARVVAKRDKLTKGHLVASFSKGFTHKTARCITSMKQGIQSSGVTGDVVVFLATTAALEIVRRFSKAKCPFIWRGLQMVQALCYPPFKWLHRWPLFRALVKHVQKLSRPMMFLSIATVFSDQSESDSEASDSSNGTQAQPESQLDSSYITAAPNTRYNDEVAETHASEKWLMELLNELKKQGISVPERLDEDELRRFYAAVNGDFSRLLSSVKRTILWRQTYNIFSPEELEAWSRLVFWHGCDVNLRPCLIIRLGLACSNLRSEDRPLFVKAVVSQIEHGIKNLVDAEHSQITVLMDCEGLSPFGFPVHTMRSCAILLQDHYPNRLGCLIIVRLSQIARVVTQTLFQVLKPATRQKLRIIGGNYQETLSQFLQSAPYFLGGSCTCSKCLDPGALQVGNQEFSQKVTEDLATSSCGDTCSDGRHENMKQIVSILTIGTLILLALMAFVLLKLYPDMLLHVV